jgi:hypothetical protein
MFTCVRNVSHNEGAFRQRAVPRGNARHRRNRTRVFQWRHSHSLRYRAVNTAEIKSSWIRTVESGKIDARYRASPQCSDQ